MTAVYCDYQNCTPERQGDYIEKIISRHLSINDVVHFINTFQMIIHSPPCLVYRGIILLITEIRVYNVIYQARMR